MISNFNEESQEILNKAKLEMLDLKHPYVGTEHLVLSLLHSDNEISENVTFNVDRVDLVYRIKENNEYWYGY